MKVLVLGASGIIGQHLMISVPDGIDAVFASRRGGLFERFEGLRQLDHWNPDVIVNLAGQNRPDAVELEPHLYEYINALFPADLARWCDEHKAHLIQVSSQAVLSTVNAYGRQKAKAEELLQKYYTRWTILRPTFVLGIRPFPGLGRKNPAERILSGKETHSVNDRWFSISFAWDVAAAIWRIVQKCQGLEDVEYGPVQLGNPERLSRYDVARLLGVETIPVAHGSLPNLAPRPVDTTYTTCVYEYELARGIARLQAEFAERQADGPIYRAKELGAFLHRPEVECRTRLSHGFSELHHDVFLDFLRAFPTGTPTSDEALLDWYRTTEAYLWELTAYHCDPGFNYAGMIQGIVSRLKAANVKRVYCLGDGTGDLTLACKAAGLMAIYNDLHGSRIAEFANARHFMRHGCEIQFYNTDSWEPHKIPESFFDAVVSLDFLEHVPNVEQWVRATYANLKPGGLFCAQNAFGLGSGPQGAMPMHLAVNDRFEKDWDPLLKDVGFVQESSNWYRKPL